MKLSLAAATLAAVASAAPLQPDTNSNANQPALAARDEEVVKDTCKIWIKKEKDWLGAPWIAKRHRYLVAITASGNENNSAIGRDFCQYWKRKVDVVNNVYFEDADNPQCGMDVPEGMFVRAIADVTIPWYSSHSKYVQWAVDKLNDLKGGVRCELFNEGGW